MNYVSRVALEVINLPAFLIAVWCSCCRK